MKKIKNILTIITISFMIFIYNWVNNVYSSDEFIIFTISSNKWNWPIILNAKETIEFTAKVGSWTDANLNDYLILWANTENLQKVNSYISANKIFSKMIAVHNAWNTTSSKIAVYKKWKYDQPLSNIIEIKATPENEMRPDLKLDNFLFYPEFQLWTKNMLRVIVHNKWKEIINPEIEIETTINWKAFNETIVNIMKRKSIGWEAWSTEHFVKASEFWISYSGKYTIEYNIDPNNKIDESNENNNKYKDTFYFDAVDQADEVCKDSDWFDFFNKWFVIQKISNNKHFDKCAVWYKDYKNNCSGSDCSVYETFCNDENIPSVKAYPCKYWCDDWACIKNESNTPLAWYEDEVIINELKSNFKDKWQNTLEWKSANYLFDEWIIWWYSDGTFKWDNLVNRAEAAKFLVLAKFGKHFNTSYYTWELSYKTKLWDVKQGEWYASFVNMAEFYNIIKWYDDWTFKPGEWVRRWEFLKMITKTFNLDENLPHDFIDINWAWVDDYAWIVNEYDLIPNIWNKLGYWDFMTRDEVSVAIYQYFQNK